MSNKNNSQQSDEGGRSEAQRLLEALSQNPQIKTVNIQPPQIKKMWEHILQEIIK